MMGDHDLLERHSLSDQKSALADRSDAFARELTELSQRHGIGITGEPHLYIMEREDYGLVYKVDTESKLVVRAA